MSVKSESMSEEEDDELPAISVNSSSQDMSTFVMPRADVLASQRAREEECEREILMLRSAHVEQDGTTPPVSMALSRSDSSGSEGEALAAAVSAMLVQPGPEPARAPRTAPQFALLRHVPDHGGLIAGYLKLLEGDQRHIHDVMYEMVCGISGALLCEGGGRGGGGGDGEGEGEGEGMQWSDAELVTCGAWLAAAAAPGGAGGGRARAALHRLLDERADSRQIALLGSMLVRAAGELSDGAGARALLELSDAARSGAGAGGDLLAGSLVLGALERLPAGDGGAAAQYTRVQLTARALAACACRDAASARALLAALPQAPRRTALPPDRLKVVVGAAKLRLLFNERDSAA